MQIYPAIDLRQNKCVRLYQGQFDQVTTYHDNPLTVAKLYAQQGAQWLHIVDLDAAQQNGQHHFHIMQEIAEHTTLKLQVGGGIRQDNQIKKLLDTGIKRIVIGSLAVTQPQQVKNWIMEFGADKIVVAVDVFCQDNQEPMIATHGWQQKSTMSLWELLKIYADSTLKHILCTDISRDGTLSAPNFTLYQQCQTKFGQYSLQASGGISTLQDIQRLNQDNIAGVIIGKALYEQRFTLEQALSQASNSRDFIP